MLELRHITKVYTLDGGGSFSALRNINLTITKGEFSAITGPSGSGKSTLMHLVGLLDKPTSGQVLIEGRDISKYSDEQISKLRNEFVGFVFQQFNLLPKLTVWENILLPTIYARQVLTFDPRQRADYLLTRFGIRDKAQSFPNQLSGGQQQRVAIIRALIMNPKLILADEPTGNLDTKTGDEIMKLLSELNKTEQVTVVVVTHEPDIAKKTRRIIKIRDGQVEKA